jgi:lysozyme
MSPVSTVIVPSPWTPGIDVSHHNGTVDWQAVAATGIKFVYLKATEGATYVDPRFNVNAIAARAAGLLIGAYHYLTAGTAAGLQTANAHRVTDAVRPDLPLALDVEENVPVTRVLTFLQIMSPDGAVEAKHVPMLYCDPEYARALTAACPDLLLFPLWIAEYSVGSPRITPWTDWRIWQYSESGSVPGISGACDLDWFHGDEAALRAFAGLLPPPPLSPAATT